MCGLFAGPCSGGGGGGVGKTVKPYRDPKPKKQPFAGPKKIHCTALALWPRL